MQYMKQSVNLKRHLRYKPIQVKNQSRKQNENKSGKHDLSFGK